jgi:predicted amidohydrolase
MGGRQEAVVKIACIQMQPVVGEKQRNLQTSLAMIEEAASQGARLIVLPGLCNSGMRGRAGTEVTGPGA